ncbi:hypothetical protein KCP71_23755 [Salmonella enterica subsp. enterica]|nr:hypothetical protein KCP71_23755 [Salmonella enterica subsp. enterica]
MAAVRGSPQGGDPGGNAGNGLAPLEPAYVLLTLTRSAHGQRAGSGIRSIARSSTGFTS